MRPRLIPQLALPLLRTMPWPTMLCLVVMAPVVAEVLVDTRILVVEPHVGAARWAMVLLIAAMAASLEDPARRMLSCAVVGQPAQRALRLAAAALLPLASWAVVLARPTASMPVGRLSLELAAQAVLGVALVVATARRGSSASPATVAVVPAVVLHLTAPMVELWFPLFTQATEPSSAPRAVRDWWVLIGIGLVVLLVAGRDPARRGPWSAIHHRRPPTPTPSARRPPSLAQPLHDDQVPHDDKALT